MRLLKVFDEAEPRDSDNRVEKWNSRSWHDNRYCNSHPSKQGLELLYSTDVKRSREFSCFIFLFHVQTMVAAL